MTDSKLFTAFISSVLALITWMLLIFLSSISEVIPMLERIFILLGGSKDGYIQFLSFIAFYYCIFELKKLNNYVEGQYSAFNQGILPTEDQLILTPDDVADIKLNILNLEKKGELFVLNTFIKKACTQYRNNNSITETLQVLDVQIENNKDEIESQLSMVRYLINAIMSLGFIGTLIGLSTAIGNAQLAKTEEGMPQLTAYLNVAFDTTLVALALGIVVNFYYYRYIESVDYFFAKSKSFILDNLISRIYRNE